MIPILLLTVTAPTSIEEPVLDYPSLVSAMRQANSITDMSFMFEGSKEYANRSEENYDFQGTYRYRVEPDPTSSRMIRAGYIDVYKRKSDGTGTLSRYTISVIDDTSFLALYAPDKQASPVAVQQNRANSNSLKTDGSPEWVLFHLHRWRPDLEEAFKCIKVEGWDDVGGRTCVRFVNDPGLGTEREGRNFARYWVDLERDAHVLRRESYMEGQLADRVDDVRLERFKAEDGRDVWFPVEAHYYSYLPKMGVYSDEPVIHGTYHFVRETLRFNQGLPDRQFSVSRGPGVDQPEALRRLEEEFSSQRKAPATFEEVQAQLESNLAEANRQSQELLASSAARVPSWTRYTSVGLIVTGIVLITSTGVLIWNRR